MDFKSRKRRSGNFSPRETQLLVELVRANADIVESKRVDMETLRRKHSIWTTITEDFNLSALGDPRSKENLQIAWKNLKARQRRLSSSAHLRTAPNGGVHSVEDRGYSAKPDREIVEKIPAQPTTPSSGPLDAETYAVDSFDRREHERDGTDLLAVFASEPDDTAASRTPCRCSPAPRGKYDAIPNTISICRRVVGSTGTPKHGYCGRASQSDAPIQERRTHERHDGLFRPCSDDSAIERARQRIADEREHRLYEMAEEQHHTKMRTECLRQAVLLLKKKKLEMYLNFRGT